MKKIISLTEGDLHRIVKESVRRILREDKYYIMPNGGLDLRAFEYDQALKNAKSLEDWDKMMKQREKNSDWEADNGLNYHPQCISKWRPGSIAASKYVNPEIYGSTKDDVLNDIERNVDYGISQYGFPM